MRAIYIAIVTGQGEEDVCVTTTTEKYTCSCGTYNKICLCLHIIAVVKHRGPTHIANFLSQNSSAPSISIVACDEKSW